MAQNNVTTGNKGSEVANGAIPNEIFSGYFKTDQQSRVADGRAAVAATSHLDQATNQPIMSYDNQYSAIDNSFSATTNLISTSVVNDQRATARSTSYLISAFGFPSHAMDGSLSGSQHPASPTMAKSLAVYSMDGSFETLRPFPSQHLFLES